MKASPKARLIRPVSAEPQYMRRDSIVIHSRLIQVEYFFVGDLKIDYPLTASFVPSSKYPCPWCMIPGTLMSHSYGELKETLRNNSVSGYSETELSRRPIMQDHSKRPDIPRLQRGNTYNIFLLNVVAGYSVFRAIFSHMYLIFNWA